MIRPLGTCILVLTLAGASAQTPQPPTAPLPAQLTSSHKLFIGNAGDQENADCLRFYNTFYAGVQGMKNFEMVGTPKEADLVLELHYEISLGAGVNGGSNTPRQFRIVILDPSTHTVLWSITERTNYAVLQKNRDKNLDETIGVLLNDFNLLMSPQPVAPNNRSTIHHIP